MNHLKVYADFLLISLKHTEPDGHEALYEMQAHLKKKYEKDLPLMYIKSAMHQENSPKPSQLIPELLARGISSKTIQDLLQMSKQSVSYHKRNPSKREYENDVFLYYLHGVHKYKKNRHVFYKTVYEKDVLLGRVQEIENE